MKVSELNNIIEDILSEEVKRAILNESKGESKEVFHIICDGEPYMNCDTQNEAEEHLDKLKKEHPGKQFIIEKTMYESHEDMLHKLDEMGEQLEEKENTNMENQEPMEGNAFGQAVLNAKEKGEKTFEFDGEQHDVEECWKQLEEEEMVGTMEEDFEKNGEDVYSIWEKYSEAAIAEHKPSTFSDEFEYADNVISHIVEDAIANEDVDEEDEEELIDDLKQTYGYDLFDMFKSEGGDDEDSDDEEDEEFSEEGECKECGQPMEEKGVDFEDMLRGRKRRNYFGQKEYIDGDNGFIDDEDDDTEWIHDHPKDKTDHDPEDMDEEKTTCEKCGKEICECGGGMYGSKKKTIRLSETELTKLIAKMVSESIPGLEAAKKSHTESGKENSSHLNDVDKKMKDYLSFDGNDNPEFPKPIGKGEKVARKNTEKQEDEIKKNFAGLENLDFDIEPDEKFKKRLKMAIEGDRLMGNAPTTEKTNVVPSNGSKLGEEPKDKDGNSIPTPETAKKIEKQVKDRGEDKKNRVLYKKEKVPVSESKTTLNNVLLEEINKMKKILEYNKKTQ